MSVDVKDIGRRAAASWFSLAFVALFAYLDWITHRSFVFILIVIGGFVAAMLFQTEIVKKLNLTKQIESIPAWIKPFLLAVPPLLYFLIRGQGTSGAGPIVVIATLATIVGIGMFGEKIDATLAGFYGIRNKILPRLLRLPLAVVVPIFVSFLIVHGNLGDLPAMWGGTTTQRQNPIGLEGRFFLATLIAAALAFLLVRDSEETSEEVEPATSGITLPPLVEAPAPAAPRKRKRAAARKARKAK